MMSWGGGKSNHLDWIYDIERVREKVEEAFKDELPEGYEVKDTEMS